MSLIRKFVAQGYQPPALPQTDAEYYLKNSGENPNFLTLKQALAQVGSAFGSGIAVLTPTCFGRMSQSEHCALVEKIGSQAQEVQTQYPRLPVLLVFGLQYSKNEREAAAERMRQMEIAARKWNLPFLGVLLAGAGKVRTHNAALRFFDPAQISTLVWLDDDILLADHCLVRLINRFVEKNGKGAVGATKIPISGAHWSSRFIYHVKQYTQPATNYPHACCLALDINVVRQGIPGRYCSDDGYVCFELLDPAADNPLRWLELVPDAQCSHVVGGSSAKSTAGRIRRMLLNHHIYMADYPHKARYYRRHMLFYGLWPLGPWDRSLSLKQATGKWILKLIYAGWFYRMGAELLMRGILNRPLRTIEWSNHAFQAPSEGNQ